MRGEHTFFFPHNSSRWKHSHFKTVFYRHFTKYRLGFAQISCGNPASKTADALVAVITACPMFMTFFIYIVLCEIHRKSTAVPGCSLRCNKSHVFNTDAKCVYMERLFSAVLSRPPCRRVGGRAQKLLFFLVRTRTRAVAVNVSRARLAEADITDRSVAACCCFTIEVKTDQIAFCEIVINARSEITIT